MNAKQKRLEEARVMKELVNLQTELNPIVFDHTLSLRHKVKRARKFDSPKPALKYDFLQVEETWIRGLMQPAYLDGRPPSARRNRRYFRRIFIKIFEKNPDLGKFQEPGVEQYRIVKRA